MKRALVLCTIACLVGCGPSKTGPEPSSQAATAKAAGGKGSAIGTPRSVRTNPAPPTDEAADKATPSRVTPSKPAAEVIEPAALAALDRMGAFLGSLQEFAVTGETTKEEVLENGQKLQFARKVTLWTKRPDGLRVDMQSDRQTRQYFYDGKTFTLYAPRMSYYASFQAPPTIRELIDVLQQRYDVELPLVDLFYFGTDRSEKEEISSAIVIGPATVGGAQTDHYAFRQADVDWQIWIERSEQPLPRKFVITTKDDPSQPQFVAVMSWNLKPNLTPESFTFAPPAGAKRIVFEADRLEPAPPTEGAK